MIDSVFLVAAFDPLKKVYFIDRATRSRNLDLTHRSHAVAELRFALDHTLLLLLVTIVAVIERDVWVIIIAWHVPYVVFGRLNRAVSGRHRLLGGELKVVRVFREVLKHIIILVATSIRMNTIC